MKRIRYRGGILEFSIPADWVEEVGDLKPPRPPQSPGIRLQNSFPTETPCGPTGATAGK